MKDLVFTPFLMDNCNIHSSLPSTEWPNVNRYEVFLSFRGKDVRKGFIEFLYEGLADSGIYAFIDHRGIEIGEEIMPKILQVIRHTEICIPVFSRNFASSKSCLREVAEMVDCKRTIMPIFYDVSPSVVGNPESHQESFCTHADRGVTSATIVNWMAALQKVSGTLGWELEELKCGENDLIKRVVSTVRRLLKKDDLDVTENLVGMDHQVREIMEKLGLRYENGQAFEGQMPTQKHVVEISGFQGIGKSTLAKIVYHRIHHLFEGCSFLDDIHGKFGERRLLLSLQEDLINDLQKKRCTLRSPTEGANFIKYKFKGMRVLIVLDDVSDFKQILSLGLHLSQYGPGSKIIVISLIRNLVDNYIRALETSERSADHCDDILVEKYELDKMNDKHAFQLFCKFALGRRPLQEEFSSWALKISSVAGGLPFLIEAVGSSLFGKPIEFWEDAFDILSQKPFNEEIKAIMKTRYEALEADAKKIFLDIACFFTGKDKTIPPYMWKACKYNPPTRIAEIHDRSLVKTTEDNEFWMHNQVKIFGMEIVKEENESEPSKRSRLWNQEDIERVLKEHQVAAVEALSATFDNPHSFAKLRFFHNFSNLRYLRMSRAIVEGNEQSAENSTDNPFLQRLKWLEWQWCHDISGLLALNLSDLVVLDLSWSTSTVWQGWREIMTKAKNLKVLILKHCSWLAESPVSDALVNLERLNLEHCSTLPGVGTSISKLRNLVSLNIKSCSFVKQLPEDIGYLKALKELYIDGTSIEAIDFPEGSYKKLEILSACNCKSLSLSNSIGNLKSLLYLALDNTVLSKLPNSIISLENLQTLSLRNCRRLRELPPSIGNLEELQVLDLSDTSVKELPSSVVHLRNLKVLKMRRTFIREFPEGIKKSGSLEEIDISGCRNCEGKCEITGLSSLRVLLLEHTSISQLIGMDYQYSNLQNLKVDRGVHISKIETTLGAWHRF